MKSNLIKQEKRIRQVLEQSTKARKKKGEGEKTRSITFKWNKQIELKKGIPHQCEENNWRCNSHPSNTANLRSTEFSHLRVIEGHIGNAEDIVETEKVEGSVAGQEMELRLRSASFFPSFFCFFLFLSFPSLLVFCFFSSFFFLFFSPCLLL